VVVLSIGVLAAMSVALLRNARVSGNESSAIASLRAIVSGQAAYSAMHNGYAADIASLAALCPKMQFGFISAEFTHNGMEKSGYILRSRPGLSATVSGNDCNGRPIYSAFYATAEPLGIGVTGSRAFAANTTSTIWQNTAGAAPAEPFSVTATITVVGSQ
jgi:hypothetical protein